jgi:hypothetical protein
MVFAMDDFNRCTSREIGPGGIKCPCCNRFRAKNRKLAGLSKLRRSRLKQYDNKRFKQGES